MKPSRAAMPRPLAVADVLKAFLRCLNRSGIAYVVVGDVRDLPDKVRGDVDFVVQLGALKSFRALLGQFATERDIWIVQVLQHEVNAFYTCLGWVDDGEYRVLKIDCCEDYVRGARWLIPSAFLLDGRMVETFDSDDSLSWFARPQPGAAFLYYLCKRLDKGSVLAANLSYLGELLEASPSDCLTAFRSIWREAHLGDLERLLRADEVDRPTYISVLRAAMHAARPKRARELLGEVLRKLKRVTWPTGLFVAVVGPDGAGKTELIARLSKSQAEGFRGVRVMHFRPRALGSLSGSTAPNTDPHASPPYSVPLSIIKLIYLLVDYVVGYVGIIRPAKVRSYLVLFDRYYYDVIVDPLRVRYGGPKWLLRAFRWVIPQPDVLFVLKARSDVIQSRKREVPSEETSRQMNEYCSIGRKLTCAEVLNAEAGSDDVALEAAIVVAKRMRSRPT